MIAWPLQKRYNIDAFIRIKFYELNTGGNRSCSQVDIDCYLRCNVHCRVTWPWRTMDKILDFSLEINIDNLGKDRYPNTNRQRVKEITAEISKYNNIKIVR